MFVDDCCPICKKKRHSTKQENEKCHKKYRESLGISD